MYGLSIAAIGTNGLMVWMLSMNRAFESWAMNWVTKR